MVTILATISAIPIALIYVTILALILAIRNGGK